MPRGKNTVVELVGSGKDQGLKGNNGKKAKKAPTTYVIRINTKTNKKISLRKYNKVTRKHEVMTSKPVKKGGNKGQGK